MFLGFKWVKFFAVSKGRRKCFGSSDFTGVGGSKSCYNIDFAKSKHGTTQSGPYRILVVTYLQLRRPSLFKNELLGL